MCVTFRMASARAKKKLCQHRGLESSDAEGGREGGRGGGRAKVCESHSVWHLPVQKRRDASIEGLNVKALFVYV